MVGNGTSDKSGVINRQSIQILYAINILQFSVALKTPPCSLIIFLSDLFKVPIKWKIIAAYLKALKNTAEWRIPFWHICFRSRYINVFVYIMQIGKAMT